MSQVYHVVLAVKATYEVLLDAQSVEDAKEQALWMSDTAVKGGDVLSIETKIIGGPELVEET